MTALAPTLQAFFTDRLLRQQQASPATVAAYRDTFRLLLRFVSDRTGKPPSGISIDHLDASMITAFLHYLQVERNNSARTRNARLAAIRSLFHYAAVRHPEHAAVIARVLAIPQTRFDKAIISYLTRPEINALLDAPNTDRWEGRRDRTLLALAVQTGLRVSELCNLDCGDITLGAGAHLRCQGKGRKQRAVPFTPGTVAVLKPWLHERGGLPAEPLFPTRTGRRLSRGALERRLTTHTAHATEHCPSLRGKTITPHVLRHTTAMELLHAGVDITVIALWLGHEDIRSTQPYLHADLAIKERALALVTPTGVKPGRYQPPDPLLAFLESL
jgi:site-specific recombinase XerD